VINSINGSQLLPTGGDPRLAIVGGIGVAILVTVVLPLLVTIKLELRSSRMYQTTTLAPGHMPACEAQRQKRTAPAPHEPSDREASDVS
jgi:hypothetical protein